MNRRLLPRPGRGPSLRLRRVARPCPRGCGAGARAGRRPEPAPGAHKLTQASATRALRRGAVPGEREGGGPRGVGRAASSRSTPPAPSTRSPSRSRPGPPSTRPPAQAARQFVFEPAEIDGKPAPIRILYRYEFVLRPEAPTTADLHRAGPRRAHEEAARRGQRRGRGRRDRHDRRRRALPLRRRRAGRARHHALGRAAHELCRRPRRSRRATSSRSTYDVEPQDAERRPPRTRTTSRSSSPRRRSRSRSSRRRCPPTRGVACPGRRATCSRSSRTCPASRAPRSGRAQLVVWGAAPQDTRVYLDGVPLPRLYHEGGFRSVVNSDMVQSVELVPGGWGAEYGRGLGGLVTVQLKPAREGAAMHGSVIGRPPRRLRRRPRAPLGSASRVEVAGRKSYLDALLPALHVAQRRRSSSPSRSYYDAQARVIVRRRAPRDARDRRARSRRDSVDDTVPSDDPDERADADPRRVLRARLAPLEEADRRTAPSSRSCRRSAPTRTSSSTSSASVPTNLEVDSTVASLRASWRKRLASWVTADRRASTRSSRSSRFSRTGSNTSPPRTGDDVRLRAGAVRPARPRRRDVDRRERGAVRRPPTSRSPTGSVHVVPGRARRAVPADREPHARPPSAPRRRSACSRSRPKSSRASPLRWSPVPGADLEGGLGPLPPAARAGGSLVGLRQPDARPRVRRSTCSAASRSARPTCCRSR